MSEHVFKAHRTVTVEVKVQAETPEEAFAKFEKEMVYGDVFETDDAVIREYLLDVDGAFQKMLDKVPEDDLEFDRDAYRDAVAVDGHVAFKYAKYRRRHSSMLEVLRKLDEFKRKHGWQGLSAEDALDEFVRFLGKE